MNSSLENSKIGNQLDLSTKKFIASKCKNDHLMSRANLQKQSHSQYISRNSPLKKSSSINNMQYEKNLVECRNKFGPKIELPSIVRNSIYEQSNSDIRNSYGKVNNKENASFFQKMPWAVDIESHYQKSYFRKKSIDHEQNKLKKSDYDLLNMVHSKQKKKISNYSNEFRPYMIKKWVKQETNHKKDHLNVKGSFMMERQSEYKKKFLK